MCPEVVAGALHPQGRFLRVRGGQHTAGMPRIDLSAREENAAARNSSPAVDRVGVGDLFVHGGGGDAEGLQADVVVHGQHMQALRVRALRSFLAGLIEAPVRNRDRHR